MLETVLIFLATVNCYPQDFTITQSNRTYYEEGVIHVKPSMYKDNVIVHELYHHCQWQWAGKKPAQSAEEWRYREKEAMRIEDLYFNQAQ